MQCSTLLAMKCFGLLLVGLVLTGADASVLRNDDDRVNHDRRPLSEPDTRLTLVFNNYFDTLVDNMQQFAINNGLDPMELPDIKEGFRVGLLLLAVSGKLWLTEGVLTDLATLRRDGDAILEYRKKVLDVHFVIGFEDLIVNYKYKAKLLGLGPKGGIIGTIKDVTMKIDLRLNMDTHEATLQDLEITHTGRLDLKFTGTILIDLVLNILSDVITLLFKGVIMNVIENNVRDAITDALTHTHLTHFI